MQYKTLLSALVLGLSIGEAAARGGFGQGQGQGQGQGKGGQGVTTATAAANNGGAATTAAASNAKSTGTATTGGNGGNGGGNSALELNPNNVNQAALQNGLNESGAQSGEAPAATDSANFINFCNGKTLTNGAQVKAGSCNGIVMGDIPASTSMVSTIITNPEPGQDLEPNQTFNLTANIANLQAGSFTNAQATYYLNPQTLNNAGQVIGHLHFTVQAMTSLTQAKALDASTFAFFKGVDDAGDGKGDLSAIVTGGLPAGVYRVCTMSSSSTHQPVLMPVAQRGAQDDCTKFTVGQGSGSAGGSTGGSGSTGSSGGNAAASATTAAAATATSASSSTSTGSAGKGGNKGSANGSGKGGAGKGATGGKFRFARSFSG